jgi:hypothetical protein
MRLASPLLTSMPGMRVLDAHVYIGCRHLRALKVHHQLTLAGIDRATLVADPENLDLLYSYPGAAEVANHWGHPRYLTRRGNFRSQKCSHPWLAPIPAAPMPRGCVSSSQHLSPCNDLVPTYDVLLLADGNECLTRGLRKCINLSPYIAGVTGAHPRVFTRLLPLQMFPCKAFLRTSTREMSGVMVLGSRRGVSTGRLAIWDAVRWRWCRKGVSPDIGRPSTGGKCANCCNRVR